MAAFYPPARRPKPPATLQNAHDLTIANKTRRGVHDGSKRWVTGCPPDAAVRFTLGGVLMSMQHEPGARSEAGAVATRAAEETKGVATTAMEGTREVATQAADQMSSVVGQAKEQIQTLVGDTRTEVQQQAETQAAKAAEGLRSLSQQFGALAEGRTADAPQLQQYLTTAQSRLSDAATRVEARGPQGLLDDLASFARRRPGMFLLCAAGAGFAAGRLVRTGAMTQTGNGDGQRNQFATYAPPAAPIPSAVAAGSMAAPRPVGAGASIPGVAP
jgi:hypothetical protein